MIRLAFLFPGTALVFLALLAFMLWQFGIGGIAVVVGIFLLLA